jgi:sec-independent protein translocase protein TatA
MFGIGTTELLLIGLVILLLFGATRLPAALKGLGQGMREFKKGFKGDDEGVAGQGASYSQAPQAPNGSEFARQLQSGVGKQVRLLPDGTLEVGVAEGATLVEVDQMWATIQGDSSTEKVPLVKVKRIIFRA